MFNFFRKRFVFVAILGVALCNVDNGYCSKVPALIGNGSNILLQIQCPLYESRDSVRVLGVVYPLHRKLCRGLGHAVVKGIVNTSCNVLSIITILGAGSWLPDWLSIFSKGLTAAPATFSCLAYGVGFMLLPKNWAARCCSDKRLNDAIVFLSGQQGKDSQDESALEFLMQLQRGRRGDQ